MRITIYIYHNQIPRREIRMMRCLKCNRPMFKYASDQVVISNAGVSLDMYEPSNAVIEYKCHSCASLYNIWFQ